MSEVQPQHLISIYSKNSHLDKLQQSFNSSCDNISIYFKLISLSTICDMIFFIIKKKFI